jgi:SAM-dependent methyltransferase
VGQGSERVRVSASQAPEIVSQLARNLAAAALGPLRERTRKLGIEGDPAIAVEALDRLAPGLAALGGSGVAGSRVLELGPGRTPDLMVAVLLAGASSATALDTTMQVPLDAADTARYSGLLDELARPGREQLLGALGTSAPALRARFEELHASRLPISAAAYDGAHVPLPDGGVELILSKSVLEHVRLGDVATLIAEMTRVLAPGGVMVHAIDLRDHLHIDGDDRVSGDWLTALRYPPPLFEAMFSRRATSINRLREPQWRALFEIPELEVTDWRTSDFPLGPGFDRSRLQPPWSTLPEHVLRVGFIRMAARRRA